MGKTDIFKKRQALLEAFHKQVESLKSLYKVEMLDDYVYALHPEEKSEELTLTFLGVIHGNEVGGFHILSAFLKYLEESKPKLPFSIGLALGNLEGFKEDKRFVESDLNRAFSSRDLGSYEKKRALPLSKLLDRTHFLLDFHQTQQPSLSPFFIFPYEERCLHFALSLSAEIPVVTHWGGGFSKDGECTDEYLNKRGGTGVTLETGGLGFEPSQVDFGLSLMKKALFEKGSVYKTKEVAKPSEALLKNVKLYTWSYVCPYPSTGDLILKAGLKNFSWVPKGEILGTLESQAFKSPEEGLLLFPKYVKDGETPPKELYRLLKKITFEELPSC